MIHVMIILVQNECIILYEQNDIIFGQTLNVVWTFGENSVCCKTF